MKASKAISPAPYINPYLIGVLLGLVLLTSFAIAGRGIGASGVASQVIAHSYDSVELSSEYLAEQKQESSLSRTWIIIEVLGIFLGAMFSAKQSGRFKFGIVKGDGISTRRRLLRALIGGIFMGSAARLARGCTSGQALTGGALMSTGSWAFMLAVFVGAYLTMFFVKSVKKDWQ